MESSTLWKGTHSMLTSQKRLWGLAVLALALAAPARAAELDRLVPSDAEQVVIVNVQQILGSDLVKKYALPQIEKQLQDNDAIKQLQKLTGFDPFKDVTSMII